MANFIGTLRRKSPDAFCELQELFLGYSAFPLIWISQGEGILRKNQDVLVDITQNRIVCFQPGSPCRGRACTGTFIPKTPPLIFRNEFPS